MFKSEGIFNLLALSRKIVFSVEKLKKGSPETLF